MCGHQRTKSCFLRAKLRSKSNEKKKCMKRVKFLVSKLTTRSLRVDYDDHLEDNAVDSPAVQRFAD